MPFRKPGAISAPSEPPSWYKKEIHGEDPFAAAVRPSGSALSPPLNKERKLILLQIQEHIVRCGKRCLCVNQERCEVGKG